MISVVFPGQGSQKTGMGLDLYKKFDHVKAIFNDADNILGYKISEIILNGPQEKLSQTIFTQPSIYLIGHVICEILKKETNFFESLFSVFSSFVSLWARVLASSLSSCLENFAKTFLSASNALC